MFEVEVKYAVEDLDRLAAALSSWRPAGSRRDEDHYFNAPDRDFAHTDEALRVRSIGKRSFVTYKGPKRDTETKTRTELEQPLADGTEAAETFRRLLEHLGYRPSGIVRKSRRTFETTRDGFELQATLDEVDGLGNYAELEVVADENDYEAARQLVLRAAAELGLTRPERRSYLEMVLNAQRPASILQTVATVAELRALVSGAKNRNLKVGVVPTMGALHAGHLALIDRARAETSFVVVTIFVNPTQFGPNEDFAKYPRTMDADIELCRARGADLVFAPSAAEVYPEGFSTFVEVGGLSDVFEGAIRPGHFRGVATVVLKLLNMAQPDIAYFGQKDAQQARIVQQMVRDLNVLVKIAIVPTVREPDGLALSSRNRYLDPTLRRQAVVLSQALQAAQRAAAGERDGANLTRLMCDTIAAAPDAAIDYAAVVDPTTFAPLDCLTGPALAIVAVRFGSTRLIDNAILNSGQ